MTARFSAALLLFAVLAAQSCKKETADPAAGPASTGLFAPGSGFRQIGQVQEPNFAFFSNYRTAALGYDPVANTIDWVHAFTYNINGYYSFTPGRRRFNIATGDSLACPGIPAAPKEWAADPGHFWFVPGTGKLYYPDDSMRWAGEAEAMPYPYRFPANPYPSTGTKFYQNGQVVNYANSNYHAIVAGGFTNEFYVSYLQNGAMMYSEFTLTSEGKYDSNSVRVLSMEMDPNGHPLSIEVTLRTIRVRDVITGATMDSIPYYMPITSLEHTYYLIAGDLRTRRSYDGNRITGLLLSYNNDIQQDYYTTFVYDVNAHKLSLRIKDVKKDERMGAGGLPIENRTDDEGNYYFHTYGGASSADPSYTIYKLTPTGIVTVAENYLNTDVGLQYMEVLNNNIFVVVGRGVAAANQGTVQVTSAVAVLE